MSWLLAAGAGFAAGWASWLLATALTRQHAPAWLGDGRVRAAAAPLSGLILAALAMTAALTAGGDARAIITFLLLATPLWVTLLTDLFARLVYPAVLGAGLLAALAVAAVEPGALTGALLSGGGAAAVAALLVLLARWQWRDTAEAPLGTGEIWIAATAGAMLGPERTVGVLFAGMVLAAAVAGLLLVTRRAGRADPLPYGVFLCAATLVALGL